MISFILLVYELLHCQSPYASLVISSCSKVRNSTYPCLIANVVTNNYSHLLHTSQFRFARATKSKLSLHCWP